MLRSLFTGFLFLACLATLNCQTYTTGLQQSVARADETSAIASLHVIAVAQRSYAATSGGGYATFPQLAEGSYLDARFNSDKPEIKGYVFSMDAGKSQKFSCNADPVGSGTQAAVRHFYIDSDSADVHVNPSQPATANDPVAQP